MNEVRLHARGPKGEAVIVLRRDAPDGQSSFTLATGERLIPGEEPGVLQTVDGRRVFRLA